MNNTAAIASSVASVQGYQNTTPASATGGSKKLTFGDILSDLNPLQYLPVVGTIYRALTGDTIPKPIREAGSVLVGGLLGGPIGVAASLATLAFEKLSGLDFEDVEQGLLAKLGASPAAAAAESAGVVPSEATLPHTGPWTATQLAAYGVVASADGTLRRCDLTGADVLNALQLREWSGAPPVPS